MMPNNKALAPLKPARQAALQAILEVENRYAEGLRLADLPHARAFLRILTGCGRLNSRVAQSIPGLCWEPKNGRNTLKQVEEVLEVLIESRGERCLGPLFDTGLLGELFPEVQHNRSGCRAHREKIKITQYLRQESRRTGQEYLQRQNLFSRAATDLNFQPPETIGTWYSRWSQEFETCELEQLFWRWQGRFASLNELKWLRMGNEPLWWIIREIGFIVQETPEYTHISERWMVPNKPIFQGAVA